MQGINQAFSQLVFCTQHPLLLSTKQTTGINSIPEYCSNLWKLLGVLLFAMTVAPLEVAQVVELKWGHSILPSTLSLNMGMS